MTTVAVMQPYFFPYAGYYTLAAAADVFVLLDDVQFPRRGYVHRNRLTGLDGARRWLTLPLAAAPRVARIDELVLRKDAGAVLTRERARFSALRDARDDDPLLQLALAPPTDALVDVLEAQLHHVLAALSIDAQVTRASRLSVPAMPAEARILSLIERVGGDRYVNATGGRALYDPAQFAARGVELRFLEPFEGDHASTLERLLVDGPAAVRAEVDQHLERSGLEPGRGTRLA